MKKIIFCLLAAASLFLAAGCKNSDDEDEPVKYTVTFDVNGGSATATSLTQTFTENKAQALTTAEALGLTYEDHIFMGWATTADATEATYTDGASYTATADITLYAVWADVTYTVTFNVNGGSATTTTLTQTLVANTATKLTSAAALGLSYTEHIFKGWATTSTATEAGYGDNAYYTAEADATLYAVWTDGLIIDDEDTTTGFVSTTGSTKTNDTRYTGYSGSSYLEGFSLGASDNIIYSINSKTEQDVSVLLRYAFWGTKTNLRGAYLNVNGVTDTEIIYLNWTSKNGKNDNAIYASDGTITGYHSIWEDSNAITVHLAAGENQIRIMPVPSGTAMPDASYPSGVDTTNAACTFTADGYLSNIDYIQIEGSGITAGSNTVAYYAVTTSADFGEVSVSPEQDFYAKGSTVTLTPTANSDYTFDVWHGSNASGNFIASTTESYSFEITEDVTLAAHFIPSSYTAESDMVGYATLTADDASALYTISGGAGGSTLTISSLSDMDTYATKLSGDTPYIVNVTGTITTASNASVYYTIGSNKTLYSADGSGRFKNVEIRVAGKNVIIRNLKFGEVIAYDTYGGTGNDALSLNGAQHVWVDHCEFQSHLTPQDNVTGEPVTNDSDSKFKKDFYDGLLDLKNGASWVTISNCYFHDHWKAFLCGSGDDHDDGDSDMRMTVVGCYFKNIGSRQPLFRWGKAHLYNNYFHAESTNSDVYHSSNCIDVRIDSQVLAEANYFSGVKNAIGLDLAGSGSTDTGTAAYSFPSSNVIDDCTNTPGTGTSTYAPAYTYTAAAASTAVADTAGANLTSLSY